jgi:trimeric autotransporter adhesin
MALGPFGSARATACALPLKFEDELTHSSVARTRLAPRSVAVALALSLCAAVSLAAVTPASAITRKQASNKALAALGSVKGDDPVIVFGLTNPLDGGSRVTVKNGAKSSLVAKVGDDGRAFFFYEDSAPFQPYQHAGRVALVGVKSGKVKVSRTIFRRPLVNGKLPAFLATSKGYGASQYRVFSRLVTNPFGSGTQVQALAAGNSAPKADTQDVTVKKNVPRQITLTGTDDEGSMLLFAITQQPDHGTLSGQLPDVTYTPSSNYLGKDKFAFKASDDGDRQSDTAHVSIDVVPLGNPPTATASAGCTAYAEHHAAVAVDGLLAVADSDDTQLAGATVRVSSNFQEGDDLLFTDQNGISASYDDASGVLALTGTASVANYQTALRTVRYRNLGARASAATKGIQFKVNDAGTDSAPTTKQVCVTGGGENDPGAGGTTSEGALLYTENDGPVPIDPEFTAGDPDSTTLSGATIQLIPRAALPPENDELGNPGVPGQDSRFIPAEDELSFTDLDNGISGSYDDVTGKLTLTGTASVAAYEATIRTVAYENTSEDPSADPRTARFRFTDSGGSTSSPTTRDIFVTPVNDAPVVTTTEGSASYVGTGPGTTIDSGLTVGDVDDTNIEGAQVSIAGGFESGDDLVYVDQLGISGVYNTGSGVLTLTGTASKANYQTALRSVKFRHTPGNASGSRTVEFIVNDGDLDSSAATKGIEVNDKPVVNTTGTALSYTEGDGAVAVDSGISAGDADSADITGATVQITSGLSQAEDQLALADQNGITANYENATGKLTLSGTASVAEYQAALGDVRYQNASENPSTATRTVTFQVDDGGTSNNLSDPVTRDIEVTTVNDAPVLTASDGTAAYTIGDTVGQQVDPALTVSDVDDTSIEGAQVSIASGFESGDELVFADQAGISGSYDAGVLTLSGSASVADYETALRSIAYRHTGDNPSASRTVDFTVNDGDDDSSAASRSISLTPPSTNVAPVVTASAGSSSHTVGDAVGQPVDPDLTVTDADDVNIESGHVQIDGFEPGDELTYADQLGITGTFDSEIGTLTLTGTAPVADYETALRSIKFRHFGDNQSAFRTVAFKVNDGEADSSFALKSIDVVTP